MLYRQQYDALLRCPLLWELLPMPMPELPVSLRYNAMQTANRGQQALAWHNMPGIPPVI